MCVKKKNVCPWHGTERVLEQKIMALTKLQCPCNTSGFVAYHCASLFSVVQTHIHSANGLCMAMPFIVNDDHCRRTAVFPYKSKCKPSGSHAGQILLNHSKPRKTILLYDTKSSCAKTNTSSLTLLHIKILFYFPVLQIFRLNALAPELRDFGIYCVIHEI